MDVEYKAVPDSVPSFCKPLPSLTRMAGPPNTSHEGWVPWHPASCIFQNFNSSLLSLPRGWCPASEGCLVPRPSGKFTPWERGGGWQPWHNPQGLVHWRKAVFWAVAVVLPPRWNHLLSPRRGAARQSPGPGAPLPGAGFSRVEPHACLEANCQQSPVSAFVGGIQGHHNRRYRAERHPNLKYFYSVF